MPIQALLVRSSNALCETCGCKRTPYSSKSHEFISLAEFPWHLPEQPSPASTSKDTLLMPSALVARATSCCEFSDALPLNTLWSRTFVVSFFLQFSSLGSAEHLHGTRQAKLYLAMFYPTNSNSPPPAAC